MPKLLILAPLPMEARAAARACGPEPIRAFPTVYYRPQGTIEVHCIGMRATRLSDVSTTGDILAIILAGVAGGLDPALGVGDIVGNGIAENLPGIHPGMVHQTDAIITYPADKAALFKETGAAAVDMEIEIVRQFASKRNIPFMAIRAISDSADQSIDPAVLGFLDANGRVRPGLLISAILRRPMLIGKLIRLGRDSKRATTNLTIALRDLIDTLLRETTS